MSGRFVRSSKFRHVYGQPTKKELCYDNIRVTKNAWDSNILAANPLYLSLNWDASGGGAFAVIPLTHVGKLPEIIPLFRGHTAAVLDTAWNPFNDQIVASGSDDAKIGIWRVPDNFKLESESAEEVKDVAPLSKLASHTRKVGHVKFHTTAENVLVSSSNDATVKYWDIEKGKPILSLQHDQLVTSFDFNYDGSLLATASRDKILRIWDARSGKVVNQGKEHAGAKNTRVVWLGNTDRLATTGFSKMSDRQVALWDTTNIDKGPLDGFHTLDSSAGICMPFYDEDTNILFLAGKGDGNIRYFEFTDDNLYLLSEYQSSEPQRGMTFLPKRAVQVHKNEIDRAFKTVNDNYIEPISFIVPRRSEIFQSDIFPDARAGVPALSADEWFGGKNAPPRLISLESAFDGEEPTLVSPEEAAASVQGRQKQHDESKQQPIVSHHKTPVEKDASDGTESPAEPIPTVIATSLPKSAGSATSALDTPEVDHMLAKVKEDEDEGKVSIPAETSSWDDDQPGKRDQKVQEEKRKVQQEDKKEDIKQVTKEEAKPEPVAVKEEKPEADINGTTTATATTTTATTTAAKEPAKNGPGKLVSTVAELKKVVEYLHQTLKDKEERIARLEHDMATVKNGLRSTAEDVL